MELMSAEVKGVFEAQITGIKQLGYEVRYVQMPWEDELIYGNAMLRFIEGSWHGSIKIDSRCIE